MDSPLHKITSNSKQIITSSVKHTPDSCKKKQGINKTLLTPCRRIGLKRKSLGHMNCKLPENDSLSSTKSDISLEKENDCVNTSSKKTFLSSDFDCKVVKEVVCKKRLVDVENCVVNDNSDCNKTEKIYFQCRQQCNSRKSEPNGDSDNRVFTQLDKDIISKPKHITLEMVELLANRVTEKKEKYQHIKLSKLYEKKHDLKLLRELTLRWKQGCQEALNEMLSLLRERGHRISMLQLLAQFQIPHDAVNFNEDVDDFE